MVRYPGFIGFDTSTADEGCAELGRTIAQGDGESIPSFTGQWRESRDEAIEDLRQWMDNSGYHCFLTHPEMEAP